jgi:hypothetical protein
LLSSELYLSRSRSMATKLRWWRLISFVFINNWELKESHQLLLRRWHVELIKGMFGRPLILLVLVCQLLITIQLISIDVLPLRNLLRSAFSTSLRVWLCKSLWDTKSFQTSLKFQINAQWKKKTFLQFVKY